MVALPATGRRAVTVTPSALTNGLTLTFEPWLDWRHQFGRHGELLPNQRGIVLGYEEDYAVLGCSDGLSNHGRLHGDGGLSHGLVFALVCERGRFLPIFMP